MKSYFARSSIVSLLSKPIDCNLDDIRLASAFQKRQVYNDLRKNAFDILESDESEYLIIDLIDERFSLIAYQDSIVTISTYMVESGYIKWPHIIKVEIKNGKYMVAGKALDGYIDEFCRRLLRIYAADNIIIHKAYMLDYYLDENGRVYKFPKMQLTQNRMANEKLKYMYDKIVTNLQIGRANVIDLCKNSIATSTHKWGLAPMYYCDEYYKTVLEQIYKVCGV